MEKKHKKHRIEKLLGKISITRKIIIIFLGSVIVPIVLLNVFYISNTEQNIQNEISRKMENSLENISSKIDAGIEELITLAVRYNSDVILYQALDNEYSRDILYFLTYQEYILNVFQTDLPFYLQIDSIVLYSDNDSLFNGAVVRKLVPFNEDLSAQELKKYNLNTLRNNDNIFCMGIGLEYSQSERINQRQISIICKMERFPLYNKYNKVLQIKLNPSYYNSMLKNSPLFDNVLLADEDGNVLFSGNSFEQYGEYDKFYKNAFSDEFLFIEKRLSSAPLYLYGYYDSRIISDQFKASIPGIIFISLISIGVSLFSILVVGNNIAKRTKKIVGKAVRISMGDFTGDSYGGEESGDEFAQIEKSIDYMSGQLSEYIEREYNAKLVQSRLERENTQAKLLALQSQVNPHFMFNALETIRLNSLDKDKYETAKMIKYMSKMFRYLVDWDKDFICIKEDINFLNEFLSIQKYRFGDEFNYIVEIDGKAEKCYLPKLIIQPLAENACIHGVETVSGEKFIKINISVSGDRLIVRVEDNGGGISRELLSKLKEMLSGGSKVEGSVGLYNVYQRLLLYYNGEFEFSIDSEPEKGTVCIISIPAQEEG